MKYLNIVLKKSRLLLLLFYKQLEVIPLQKSPYICLEKGRNMLRNLRVHLSPHFSRLTTPEEEKRAILDEIYRVVFSRDLFLAEVLDKIKMRGVVLMSAINITLVIYKQRTAMEWQEDLKIF